MLNSFNCESYNLEYLSESLNFPKATHSNKILDRNRIRECLIYIFNLGTSVIYAGVWFYIGTVLASISIPEPTVRNIRRRRLFLRAPR